jgi:hypothetical protein
VLVLALALLRRCVGVWLESSESRETVVYFWLLYVSGTNIVVARRRSTSHAVDRVRVAANAAVLHNVKVVGRCRDVALAFNRTSEVVVLVFDGLD